MGCVEDFLRLDQKSVSFLMGKVFLVRITWWGKYKVTLFFVCSKCFFSIWTTSFSLFSSIHPTSVHNLAITIFFSEPLDCVNISFDYLHSPGSCFLESLFPRRSSSPKVKTVRECEWGICRVWRRLGFGCVYNGRDPKITISWKQRCFDVDL